MALTSLTALSPLDGRYAAKVDSLRSHFSEFGLIRNRVRVEIAWLKALAADPAIAECTSFSAATQKELDEVAAGDVRALVARRTYIASWPLYRST